jgi:hypothetical protein
MSTEDQTSEDRPPEHAIEAAAAMRRIEACARILREQIVFDIDRIIRHVGAARKAGERDVFARSDERTNDLAWDISRGVPGGKMFPADRDQLICAIAAYAVHVERDPVLTWRPGDEE